MSDVPLPEHTLEVPLAATIGDDVASRFRTVKQNGGHKGARCYADAVFAEKVSPYQLRFFMCPVCSRLAG